MFGDEMKESHGKLEVLKSGCSPTALYLHTGSLEPKQYLFQLQRANKCSQLAQHLRGGENLC